MLSKKDKKYTFYHKISIPNLLGFEDYKKVNELYSEFKDSIEEIESVEKLNLLSEFYQNEITKYENGFNQAFNKCLAYIAIVAFIAPFFLSFLTTQTVNIFILMCLLTVFFYLLVNIIALVMMFTKVKHYLYLEESEIHKYEDVNKTRAYINFHTSHVFRKKSLYHISIIRNMEKYIMLFAIVTFGSWIVLFLGQQIEETAKEEVRFNEEVSTETYLYKSLELNEDENYSFNVNNKNELEKIDRNYLLSAREIIIFYSKETEGILSENLESYFKLNIVSKVDIVLLVDPDLDEGEFKILIKGEE